MRSSPTPFILVILQLLFALIAGCAVHREYPIGWPQPKDVVDTACTGVAGLYRNIGANSPNWHIPLTSLLFGKFSINADSVLLTWKSRTLDIIAVKGGKPVENAHLAFTADKYICSPKGLKLKVPAGPSSDDSSIGVRVYASKAVILSRGEDGSLIVESSTSDLALILLVIPVFITEQQWHRFDLVSQ